MTIIVTGPPYSGVEQIAEQVAKEAELTVVPDGDIKDVYHLNRLLEDDPGPVVIATSEYAHIVHEFVGVDKVVYVMRPVEDIEREMEIAEYDTDAHIEYIVRDVGFWFENCREAFDAYVDLTKSLPRILYDWWEWQKKELAFWRTEVEERSFFTSNVEKL